MDTTKTNWMECDGRTVASARELYEGYLANSDGLAWDGKPCPTWDALNDKVKSHWCAAVIKARALAAAGIL